MGCGTSRSGSHVVSPLSKAVILPHIAWISPNSTNPTTKTPAQKASDVVLLEKGVQVDNLLDLVDRTTQTDLPFAYTEDIQELLDDNQNYVHRKSHRESKSSGGLPGRSSTGSADSNPMKPLRPLISDVETQTHLATESAVDDVKSVLVQTEHHIVVLGRRMMHLDIKQQANKVTIDIGIQVVNSKTDHFTQTDLMVLARKASDNNELKNVRNLLRVQSSDPSVNFRRDKQILLNNKNYLELPTTADFEAQTDPVQRALAANAADSDLNIFDTIDSSPIAHIEKELENGQMTLKGAGIHDSIARLLEDVEDSLTEPSVSVSYRVVEVPKRDSAVQTDNDPITDEAPEFAARPPPCKKREMIPNMAVFKEIDEHCNEVPESARSSVKNLVQYLTSKCVNDLQKVRAFFKWIANNITYDWRYMEIKMSAEEVLRRGEGVCKDYCKLFSEMCKLADIRCKKLHGFAKGYDYRPGHCFTPGEDITHAWNAVFIFGAWRLIDTTWGTGYTDHTGRFQRKINEHFFLTDPEIMVWTHFPHDDVEQNYSRWQLIDKAISLETFNSLPKTTPFFFEYCLKVRSKPQNPITFKVQTEIKLSSHEPMRYKFKLYPADELENSSLNSYVFCQLKEDRLVGSFSVIPPVEGTYYLKIYAKSEREMKNDTSLHNVVIFYLDCIRARKYLQPYPVNEIPWGPTQTFFDYKMKLINHSGPVIATWGGRRKLTLEYNENMVVTYQLFDADAMEMDVKGTIQREDSDKRVTFTVTPIRMGYFKFLIFGMPKPKSKGKWRMPLLASFLIDCKLCRTPDEDNPAKVQQEQKSDAEAKDPKKKEKKKMRPMMMR